ncbi:MAG: polysaccharide pyruvyl transferase family protein [Clostridia bacterium]|nr:polysaccharide pyruvyl transferase family protein [Clostridia bacterium]
MRILMRAQMQHDKAFAPDDVLLKNLMGGNIGNWLYQYSLFRALMIDENTVIDIFNPTKQTVDEEFIEKVNSDYDVFVLPLANAFKLSFINEMKSLTKLLNGLKIPCVVPGVGIQAKNGVNFSEKYEYIDESKEFIKAILKKSNMIGVRGEATGEFFKSLGFKEEKDFTVIGCPSLYTFGMHLPEVKPLSYSENSKLLFSSKVEHENKNIAAVLKSFTEQHPNYCYAPQRLQDMLTCFYGNDYRIKSNKKPKERFFDPDKAVIFTSPTQWINFTRENIDFSVGTRIHGNVAAVLGGVPSFIMATDQRVSELAGYHNIACVPVTSVTPETKLTDIMEKYDFSLVHKGHRERFNHFVDFLEKNDLKTVYSADRSVERVYFDSVLESLELSDNLYAFGAVSTEEKLNRVQRAASFYADKAINAQNKLDAEKEKNAETVKNLKAALADAESKKGWKGLFK